MIDSASERAVNRARWGTSFVKPLYESYCFSRIPTLISSLFGVDHEPQLESRLLGSLSGRYQHVILLFIDGFGWRFLEQYGERYPFLRRFVLEGTVTKLTSQFPSTTSAHTACIHTGLDVGQSGVFEWFYYEPLLDAIIAPLLFSFAGDKDRGTLERTGIGPDQLLPGTTLYGPLAGAGVKSSVFGSRDYTPSPFSRTVCAGAELVPFGGFEEALNAIVERLMHAPGPSYSVVYFDRIDAAGHHHGVNSPEFAAEVDACFRTLDSTLHRRLATSNGPTLLLMTADHGQVETNPATTTYLNRTVHGIDRWMMRDRRGNVLAPAGSSRDMFLYIKPDYLEVAQHSLRDLLAGRAEVHRVQDLIADGFFGSAPPAEVFLQRVGNLVVLPYAGETVWWHQEGKFSHDFFGHHGGLTPEEMHTELLALPYG